MLLRAFKYFGYGTLNGSSPRRSAISSAARTLRGNTHATVRGPVCNDVFVDRSTIVAPQDVTSISRLLTGSE